MSPSITLWTIMISTSLIGFAHSTDIYEMSESDFRSKILMHLDPKPMLHDLQLRKTYTSSRTVADIPESWDWRDHGAVTPVKNQEACGTCWAFSTTGNLEGQLFLNKSTDSNSGLIGLSEEFLIDCDDTDCGMFGGWPYRAMDYIISRNGIPSDTEYPYCCDCNLYGPKCYPCMSKGYNKSFCGNHDDLYCNTTWDGAHCPSSDWTPAMVITDWMTIGKNEEEIAVALYELGPLSVLMNAAGLQRHKSGIFNPRRCDPESLDHGVLLVGYGTENGEDYWIVKNSWGEKWGESGYFRIIRGEGKCGINTAVVTGCIGECKTAQILAA